MKRALSSVVHLTPQTHPLTTSPVTHCSLQSLSVGAGLFTTARVSGLCPRNLVRTLSSDLNIFLRGLALWLNEGIETRRWGNGTEETEYSPDSKNLLPSEIMKGDSDRERVDLKGQIS